MWIKWIGIIGFLIAVSLGIAAVYGKFRWQSDTDRLRAKLTNGRRTIKPQIYDQKEIEGLPEPVQRFFRTVIKDGQAIVAAVKLSQQRLFNMSETEDKSKCTEKADLSALSTAIKPCFYRNCSLRRILLSISNGKLSIKLHLSCC